MIWVLTHHQECHFDGEPKGTMVDQIHAIAGSTMSIPQHGNRVHLIRNESFFSEICEVIESAQSSVHLETFLWEDGKASEQVIAALLSAAHRGVDVRILIDARGSSDLSSEAKDRLREAGCQVESFHRWRFRNLGKFNVRDHRKVVVADGRTAIVGGHCIADYWIQADNGKPPNRDISAKISGPVVATIQSAFFENWQEVTGELFVDESTFPRLDPCGEITTHVAFIRADGCPSSVQVLHYMAIAFAKQSIRIQNPYFLPDPRGAAALERAAKRGVDVRIMTNSIKASDTPYVQRAGHALFGRLLKAGVRIYEFQPTLLHQKVIAIDEEWCALGSSNFDDRSFEINDEITMGIANQDIAREIVSIFDSDIADCEELNWQEWQQRPVWKNVVDRFFYLFNEQF